MEVLYGFILLFVYGVFGAIVAGAYYEITSKEDDSVVDEAVTYMMGFIWPVVLLFGIGKLFFIAGKKIGKLFVE